MSDEFRNEADRPSLRRFGEHTKEACSLIWPEYRQSFLGKNGRYKFTAPLIGAGVLATGIFFPGQIFGVIGMLGTGVALSTKDLKHTRPLMAGTSLLFCVDLLLKGAGGWAGAILSGASALRTSLIAVTPDEGKTRKYMIAGICAGAFSIFGAAVAFVPGFSLTLLNVIPMISVATGLLIDSQKSENSDVSRVYRFMGQPANLAYHVFSSHSFGAIGTASISIAALGNAMKKFDYGKIREENPDKSVGRCVSMYISTILRKTPVKILFKNKKIDSKPDTLGRLNTHTTQNGTSSDITTPMRPKISDEANNNFDGNQKPDTPRKPDFETPGPQDPPMP